MIPAKEELIKELTFKTSRSGGKGGQNVNKVSSKVELIFNIEQSLLFTVDQKSLLIERLATRLDAEGNLHIVSQEDRSQLLNKQRTILKLVDLLARSLHVQKKRKPTKTPKAVIEKRLNHKSAVSSKKENRKRPSID
ncbi:alternative ribosome rescue aminoacyl-tRNA hydrolase ArfB [Pedobacter sp. Hv1]|uniref:alternative ribosome rescue aminoacyl-tRNA hydrolase ArfB n=1 Tax=Pedobacter sp. Hv1 TaxID=1740090 RepID=UPI0006D8AED2|nr:alternative ribosome rescue aminoacyl-tRNA hydrolase ArfB [Pedobacter sp. Hv1]KQB99085.1 peptide chain release factor 1 [Pedobacter sp. Hv1]